MVVVHALRCLRYRRRGAKARDAAMREIRAALQAKQASSGHPADAEALEKAARSEFANRYLTQNVTTTARCGLHTVDVALHVNNAKYLELLEYGRWYHLTMQGMESFMLKHKGIFVVSDLSIQYVREIRPFAHVQITTQYLPVEAHPQSSTISTDSAAGGTASSSSSATATPSADAQTGGTAGHPLRDYNSGKNKRILVSQAIWNEDGTKLHAAAIMEAALLAPVAYGEYLENKYGPPPPTAAGGGAKGKEGSDLATKAKRAGRVTLDCHRVIAECAQVPLSQAERLLYEGRDAFLRSMALKGRAEAELAAVVKPAWLTDMSKASAAWRRSIRNMAGPSVPQGKK